MAAIIDGKAVSARLRREMAAEVAAMKETGIIPGLAVVLGMFCAAALMLEGEERGLMLRLIGLYGAAPVLVGNAVAWPLYWKLRPKAPRRRKTVRQELMEAAAKEAAGPERGPAQRTEAVRPPAQDAAGAPAPGAPEAEAPARPGSVRQARLRPLRGRGGHALLHG